MVDSLFYMVDSLFYMVDSLFYMVHSLFYMVDSLFYKWDKRIQDTHMLMTGDEGYRAFILHNHCLYLTSKRF